MYIIDKDSPTLGALLKIYFVWQSDIHSIFRKHRKTSIVRESWKTLWSYTECLSADLDNKAAVSSLFTEIKSDVTADDAQYNLVRFLAKKKKKGTFKFAVGSKISVELSGKQSSNIGFQPQIQKEIAVWETTDDNCDTAASDDESGGGC